MNSDIKTMLYQPGQTPTDPYACCETPPIFDGVTQASGF